MGRRPKTSESRSQDGEEYEDFIREVGARVRAVRTKTGWTQYDLADRAGKNQSYIFEIENGSANPTLRMVALFADVLGVDARELMPEGTKSPPSSMAMDRLEALVQKLASLLNEWEVQGARREEREAKRRAEELASIAALAMEMRQLPALRFVLDRPNTEHDRDKVTKRSRKQGDR